MRDEAAVTAVTREMKRPSEGHARRRRAAALMGVRAAATACLGSGDGEQKEREESEEGAGLHAQADAKVDDARIEHGQAEHGERVGGGACQEVGQHAVRARPTLAKHEGALRWEDAEHRRLRVGVRVGVRVCEGANGAGRGAAITVGSGAAITVGSGAAIMATQQWHARRLGTAQGTRGTLEAPCAQSDRAAGVAPAC